MNRCEILERIRGMKRRDRRSRERREKRKKKKEKENGCVKRGLDEQADREIQDIIFRDKYDVNTRR